MGDVGFDSHPLPFVKFTNWTRSVRADQEVKRQMCVLRAYGEKFDVDEFAKNSNLSPYQVFQKGERRGPCSARSAQRTGRGRTRDRNEGRLPVARFRNGDTWTSPPASSIGSIDHWVACLTFLHILGLPTQWCVLRVPSATGQHRPNRGAHVVSGPGATRVVGDGAGVAPRARGRASCR